MANYKNQVRLLLSVLPEVAKEKCFALHGGTAINLFIRNMPRMSIDIDLTYIPLEDRSTSFHQINAALLRIKNRLESVRPELRIIHQPDILKLQISTADALIKIEVNQGIRGIIDAPIFLELCDYTQETFDAFCAIQGVPFGQLYGGKICAALDRQHPRDLFDIKDLLENEGITNEVKKGFLFALLSSNRPVQEVLLPHFLNQKQAFIHQFQGMSEAPFTYNDFIKTRETLVHELHQLLTENDRRFLLDFESGKPDWSNYDFERFPSIQWKLQNIKVLKQTNSGKYAEQIRRLQSVLGI